MKEYVPKSVKETGTTDMHGNMGYGIEFSDGSKAFMLAKRAPEVGVAEYGEIIDAPKKSGDGTYRKFVRKQREEVSSFTPKHYNGSSSKEDGMRWGNSLTNATSMWSALLGDGAGRAPDELQEVILETAQYFYDHDYTKQPVQKTIDEQLDELSYD